MSSKVKKKKKELEDKIKEREDKIKNNWPNY